MKTVYFLLITTLCFSYTAFTQSDTSRVEQYCEVVALGKLFSNKITIDIDFGEGRGFWIFKDTRIKDEITGKIKKFKSTVDALNYLGGIGWTLLNAFPIADNAGFWNQNGYHFYFKKSFLKSELVENTIEGK